MTSAEVEALELLASYSDFAAGVFRQQLAEVRGSWEAEDWRDRIVATIRFFEQHEWSETTLRWVPKT